MKVEAGQKQLDKLSSCKNLGEAKVSAPCPYGPSSWRDPLSIGLVEIILSSQLLQTPVTIKTALREFKYKLVGPDDGNGLEGFNEGGEDSCDEGERLVVGSTEDDGLTDGTKLLFGEKFSVGFPEGLDVGANV
jgi:hypothetical protein